MIPGSGKKNDNKSGLTDVFYNSWPVCFKNEPQARALYDKMIEAFRKPQTLSY